jgi:phosphoribosyl 1,2-cyclic phosphodiesterase
VQGVERLARRFSIPVYSSKGTQHAMSAKWGKINCHAMQCTQPTQIGELEISPYTVPHDAREPLQYVVNNGTRKLGLLTDVGHTTPHIQESLNGCDALILEANHDLEKLANNPRYPSSLKARIRSIYGHLDNKTAADLLHRLDTQNLQHLIAAHLSVDNNHPDLVRSLFAHASGRDPNSIHIADQEEGSPWITIQ